MSEAQVFSRRWRPAPLLPASDTQDRGLIFVIATLCFLACLTLLVVVATNRAARDWTDQLQGQVTVIVRPNGAETPDTAAARAAEALAGVSGVAEARALEKAEAEALVAPWLGNIGDLEDLPVPRLVAVELDAKSPATAKALEAALKVQGLDAIVDNHSVWTRDIAATARGARWVGLGIFVLIALAAGSVVAFATRAGLRARRDLVEVLHLTGATDLYIARLFQTRFAQMAGWAGTLGALGAAVLGAGARLAGSSNSLGAILPVDWLDLSWLLGCPLAAALIAAIVARLTAEAVVREMT